MSSKICVPLLSSQGWITDPGAKADILLSHFFESNKSQSLIYGKNVSSLQWIIQRYSGSISDMVKELTYALENYLGRYYVASVVTVISDDNTANLNTQVTLTLHCDVIEDGITYSIGKLLQISDSKLSKITTINNG